MRIEPTRDQLKELFDYNNGNLLWKIRSALRIKIGDIAGCYNATGYIHIRYKNIVYGAQRLIWIYHNGNIPNKIEIDHIDQNPLNNKIENLRLATYGENATNRHKRTGTSSKYKGVTWSKQNKKWVASIKLNRKPIYLGLHDTEEEAYNAYCNAAKEYHGEFACLK